MIKYDCIISKFVVFLIFVVDCTVIRADEVLGCGGFLKSHVPIDFSKVEIRLVTKQGIIKDRTTAAPNNGYYFVPLYDKGDLRLELSPPPGWSFEPQTVSLSIDGANDLCSQGKDINFVFQGFGITGKVYSLGDGSKGPEGVTVTLQSGGDSRTTSTDSEGNFFFTPVFPGRYKVSIGHPKWKIYKQYVDVTVAESNAELPKKSLVVQGYDVKGSIKSEGQAVKDATIILFSKDEKNKVLVDGCNKDIPGDLGFKKKPLCYVVSLDNGQFEFGTVPNGQYYIEANFKGQNIYFQPERIGFEVFDDSVELKEHFEIVGFSISGRVLRASNIPIANAKIFLNGQHTISTDKNGYYKLERIKAGQYQIKAEYDDVIFEKKSFYINPTLQQLPDIFPQAFKVCGTVSSDHSQTVAFSKVGSTTLIHTITSLHDGGFCQYLAPGKYEVQVVVNDEDKQKGLQFFPITQTVEVISDKITNVIFSQLKTTISGKVVCFRIDECDGLTVILKNREANEISLRVKGDSYSVSDVYPGSYEVSLVSNKFCWQTEKQMVNINSAIAIIPPFIQKGYVVSFLSSHDTQVVYKVPGQTKNIVTDIPRHRLNVCLEKPGEYTFNLSGCHSYPTQSVTYKTDAEVNEIILSALKHTQTLAVKAESDFGNLQISVKIGTDKIEKILKYQKGLYELDVLLEPGESAVIIPQSDTLFVTPPILSIDGGDDCGHLGVKFVAVRGKLFKGKVVPALAGVTITVESSDTEKLVVETDANGVFKFPPLDVTKDYKINAKKDSYVLTGPDQNGNFLAHKLAEVVVEVVDGFDNKPLSGVLLSLSGGESYRKNLQSGEDGKISFHSLSPSEYFLRPMMKEYLFEPNSKIIPVNEGQTVNVHLKGRRVAYSAFGQVVSLNGEPEDDMVIIATGLGNCSHYSEETTCESSGLFRIRGLQPYCSYRVIVKGSLNDNFVVERSAPEFIDIENIKEDMKDLKLVVFRPAAQMDILVKVCAENIDHYKHLKVKLSKEEGSSVVIHTAKLEPFVRLTKSFNPGILVYMPSVPIDNSHYVIQLDTSVQTTKWQSQAYQFRANNSFTYAELNFNVKSNISEQPIKQTSIWSLVFIFSVLFALYNIEFVANILGDKVNFNINSLVNFIPSSNANQKTVSDYYDDAQIEQIVQSINNPKRKPKPKKA